MYKYIPSTGEYWSQETQRGYAALIARQYHKGTMSLHQLEDELAGDFITQADFDAIVGMTTSEEEEDRRCLE